MSEAGAIVLIDAVYEWLRGIDDDRLPVFLTDWPLKPFNIRKTACRLLPVLSYLPEIVVNDDDIGAQVASALKFCAGQLSWRQTYTPEDFGSVFLEKYGWTELIGSRGPVVSDAFACGFLLLGPNIEYPKHSHAAEEVYIPLIAEALWIQGDGDWTRRQSGAPIYHRPWMAHGMCTGSTPLLALYIWRGKDLAQKSHIESQCGGTPACGFSKTCPLTGHHPVLKTGAF